MVGSSKRKSKPVKFIGLQRSVTHNSGRQGRRQKTLSKKKYYLDIKNDNTRRKLEESLISLGATVEVFFDPCVNAVVTDRQQWLASLGNNSGPSPSPIPSLSSVYSPSTGEQAPRRNKTRLDSILEQARLQPQQQVRDPLDDAKKCGVPIYSLAKFSQFLGRLEAIHKKAPPVKGKKLEGHFIKIEHCNRNHRPVYGEFKKWAFINLNSQAGSCPFDPPRSEPSSEEEEEESVTSSVITVHPPNGERKDERSAGALKIRQPDDKKKVKSRSRMTRSGGPKLPGYCEMCNVQYASQRSHILCESHVNAKADADYLALDALISRGPDMEAFVKLNKVDALNYRRSLRRPMSPHTVNGGLRKRSKAAGARTRSMSGGQLYLPSGLLGTTAEDVGNPARTVGNSVAASNGPGRRRAHTERAASADEPGRPEVNGGRRRRLLAKRRSQLAVLSDEAQNFMFREPMGPDSSDDEEDDEEDEEEEEDSPSSRVSVKIEVDSNSLDSQGIRRKKRRSQAEAFIEDNREYYKFETPSSRLRFHDDMVNKDDSFVDANCADVVEGAACCCCTKDCCTNREGGGCKRECVVKKEGGCKECFVKREGGCAMRRSRDDEVKSEPEREAYRFSFERVPRSEPWYQTFLRQDLGEEFYYSLPSAADEPFPLPYQLPPPRLPHPHPPGRRGGRRRRGGRFGHLDRRPRKSPRCHASTLAILSGFIQRRRRDSTRGAEPKEAPPPPPPPPVVPPPTTRPRGRPRRTVQEQRPPLPEIKEDHGSATGGDPTKLSELLDRMFDTSGDADLENVDPPVNLDALVPLDVPPPGVAVPVCALMQERCDVCVRPPPPPPAPSGAPAPPASEWRARKRKKRRPNMTGWPDARKKPNATKRVKTELRVLEQLVDEETNGSSCYTEEDSESHSECVDSDERTLAHLVRRHEDEGLGMPDYCTRRLRSAGTPSSLAASRRESPRKVNKTIKFATREGVS